MWRSILSLSFISLMLVSCTLRSATDEVLKVGAVVPLSGNYAVLGERIRDGLELAKSDILEKDGFHVELIHEDACLPKQAISAFRKLIEVDSVDFIGGSFCLVGLVPSIPFLDEHDVIAFNTAANPDDTLYKSNVFSTNVSIEKDSEKISDYIFEKVSARSIAVFTYETVFGEAYRKYVASSFQNRGGEVVFDETYPLGTQDFRTEILKIKASKPDAVFVINLANSLGVFLKQAKELGLEVPIIGHSEAEDPTVIEAAGDASEGFIVSSSEPLDQGEHIEDFRKRFLERFGYEPDVLAANAYDSLWLQVNAFNVCGLEMECLRKTFFAIKDFKGVSGDISIQPDGSSTKSTMFKVVEGGRFIEISD